MKINNIAPDKDEFLKRTAVIADSPKRLWYIGKVPKLGPSVAIVGSRKPTPYGHEITLRLASALAARGVIIVSGLALGHDALAHRGALETGGITVAVQGNGLSQIYPRTNQNLAEEIIDKGGLILSEYPPEMPVKPWNFLARNRIVTALADVVIVVEAAAKSGTLNTAAHALEQGKELMAVPGNITSPLSAGCNRLIAQGAAPVLSIDDVLARLDLGSVGSAANAVPLGDDDNQTLILQLIHSGVNDGDELVTQSKLSASEVSMSLTMLEINGVVRPLGANKWGLK